MWIPAEGTLSRRATQQLTGPYQAGIPPQIAGLDPDVSAGVAADAEQASVEMAHFDAEAADVMGTAEFAPMASVLLRSESAASSQIEHLTAGARQLALAELPGAGSEASKNARTVAGNVAAMRAALDLAERPDSGAILAMHAALLDGHRDARPGAWREEQVWVGGRAPTEAAFVPPPPEYVPLAMNDLAAFCARRDVPALTHVAVAHAQFETVHPFVDGNGRTGRALAHAMLRRSGITRRVTVPISAGILTDTGAYFAALDAFRQGRIEPIVEIFVRSAETAISNGRRLLDDLRRLRSDWKARVTARAGASVWRALDLVIAQPVLDVPYLQQHLQVAYTSAAGAIQTMTEAGILLPSVVGRRRNRVWHAPEVLEALDDFAERAGRRS
ncbi:Fic family protein [Serinibacter salmoneus]|uniref:Fic family protein n=1 Tax=Serinibacter salmoneus TaxID=556530 RepID=A0A2A9D4C6_9MICO|nr:Fic family protein [Serinibacter salmoneus]